MTYVPPLDGTSQRWVPLQVPPPGRSVPEPKDVADIRGVDLREAARLIARSTGCGSPPVLWVVDTGQERARPVLDDGKVLVSGWGPEIKMLSDVGVLRGAASTEVEGEPVRMAAAPNGNLYTAGPKGVEALDFTGGRVWLVKPSRTLSSVVAAGPDGTAYVQDKNRLYALDPRDGHVAWSYAGSPARRDVPPTIAPDGTVYYGTANDAVVALAPDGTEKWRFETYETLSAPLFPRLGVPGTDAEGNVYLHTRDGHVHKLDATGTEQWSVKLEGPPAPDLVPQVDGQGRLQVIAGSTLIALDPATGQALATTVLEGNPEHLTAAPRGGAVIAYEDGRLEGRDADGQPTWVENSLRVHERPTFGPDGRLYVGSGRRVLCLAPLDSYDPALPQSPPAGTIEATDDGWIVIGDVRVPTRRVSDQP